MQWGLINRVVPDVELMNEAQILAESLASGPTPAFGSVKQLLNESFSNTLETQMEIEALTIARMARTHDGREGTTAFVEKRRPNFTGQ